MRPAALILAPLSGCASFQPQGGGIGAVAGASTGDAQEITGQVAAGVQADLNSRVDATGYHSEFGVGAVLVVSAALVLTLVLSHLREMARIRKGR